MDTSKALPTISHDHWGYGCDKCRYGYVYAPDPRTSASLPLYLQRAVQAANGDIEFCDCRAGIAARSSLRRTWTDELKLRPDLDAIKGRVKDETAAPPIRYVAGA